MTTLICSLHLVTSPNFEDTSSKKCPPKDMILLLTPLSRNPEIREEATRRFPRKNKGTPSERFSPLHLEHVSKKAKLESPSSTHLGEKDKESPNARHKCPSRLKLARHDWTAVETH